MQQAAQTVRLFLRFGDDGIEREDVAGFSVIAG